METFDLSGGGCYSNGDCHALMISSVIHRGCGGGGRCGGGECCRSCPRRSCNCCGEMLLAESRILLFLEKWDPTNGRVREKEMSVRCEPSEPLYCLQDIKNPRSRCRRKVPSLIRSREKQRGGLNLPEPAPARGRREGTNRTRSNRTGMYIFNSVHFLRCSV